MHTWKKFARSLPDAYGGVGAAHASGPNSLVLTGLGITGLALASRMKRKRKGSTPD